MRKILTIGEYDAEFEQSTLPKSLLLAWNTTLPDLEIQDALVVTYRFRIEPKRMITAPLFT